MYSYNNNNIFIVYMHIECHLPMNITSILYYIIYTIYTHYACTHSLHSKSTPNQTQGPRTII